MIRPARVRGTPVLEAIGLRACPRCKALRGDPCRTPSGRTRMPHDGRRRECLLPTPFLPNERKLTTAIEEHLASRRGRRSQP